MFLMKETEVWNLAYDTTTCSCSLTYEEAHRKSLNDTHIVRNWFR